MDGEPYFYIETCSGCEGHQTMYSNHSEQKYENFAIDLKTKLQEMIPELGDNVLINKFKDQYP
jgi:hypothetical protein